MPINEHGIIAGATNPANEGLTVREALTREIGDVYRAIQRVNNVYVQPEDAPIKKLAAANAALAGISTASDWVEALTQLSELFREAAERYQGNTLQATLADCGVDMNNIGAILANVFGNDAQAAMTDIQNAGALWQALNEQLTPAVVADLCVRFKAMADAIASAATTTSPVAGV